MVHSRNSSIEDVVGGFWVLGQPGLCGEEWNKGEQEKMKEGKREGKKEGEREGKTDPQMIEQKSHNFLHL